MKDFPIKANESAGDDSGTALDFGAHEFNSIADENMNAITSTGQALTPGTDADTSTDTLARALTIAGQSATVYVDSGAANAYVLSDINSLVQPAAYYDGMRILFKPTNTNTGASVINVEALGSKKILTIEDAVIGSNKITIGAYSELIYDTSADSGAGAFVLITSTTTTVINSQATFNDVFIGSVLTNQTIYLSLIGSPYSLTAPVLYAGSLKIDADPGVVIRRATGNYNFVSQGSLGNEVSKVYFSENWMFDGQGGIHPTLGGSTKFTGNGGFNNIKYTNNCVFHCYVKNSYASGNGGGYYDEDGLSHSNDIKNVSYCKTDLSDGGIANLSSSLTPSDIPMKNIISNVSYCESVGSGGGVGSSLFCDIKNIYNNESGTHGGGVAECSYSTITDIYHNTSGTHGGGVSESPYSTISNIYKNTSTTTGGGGVYDCDNSNITKVYDNTATTGNGGGIATSDSCVISDVYSNIAQLAGGGLYLCLESTTNMIYSNQATNGGGVSGCDNSTISKVSHNTASIIGGGVSGCDNSVISDIHDNSSVGSGGGVSFSDSSTISKVYNNSTTNSDGAGLNGCTYCTITDVHANDAGTGSGGGVSGCNNSLLLGNFTGNIATGAYKTIANCTSSLALILEGPTGFYNATSARQTLNY